MRAVARVRRGCGLALATASALLVACAFLVTGCASPGPPRAPSLALPEMVKDLSAMRQGDTVELRFTLPERTTDKLLIKDSTLRATICREERDAAAKGSCATLSSQEFPAKTGGRATLALMRDGLGGALAAGPPRVVAYRVELLNGRGRTAGFSEAAYAAAGAAPPRVEGLRATGSRLGIVLQWQPVGAAADQAAGQAVEVMLRREDLAPKPPPQAVAASDFGGKKDHAKAIAPGSARRDSEAANVVWLNTDASHAPFAGELEPVNAAAAGSPRDITLDTTAAADEPYRYTAERRLRVQLGGRTLEMRSAESAPVTFVLREVYPPPPPTDLTAAAFAAPGGNGALAVDLIWQPVDDAGLAGYNVYREPVDANGTAVGPKVKVNPQPVALPAFHDALPAGGALRYRYRVTAVDAKGNESGAAVALVDASGA